MHQTAAEVGPTFSFCCGENFFLQFGEAAIHHDLHILSAKDSLQLPTNKVTLERKETHPRCKNNNKQPKNTEMSQICVGVN